jgi:hypothetical protein
VEAGHEGLRELAELRSDVDGSGGLRVRALKYEMLQQAFAAIERAPTNTPTQTSAPTANIPAKQIKTSPSSGIIATVPDGSTVKMNPERARLLSATPHPHDPDRDLYEPKLQPKLRDLSKKADNANNVPLRRRPPLPPFPTRSSLDRDLPGTWRKRRHEGEPQASSAKRPRVDPGHVSALVQATLAASGVGPPSSHDGRPLPTMSRFPLNYSETANRPRQSKEEPAQSREQRIASVQAEVDQLIESCGELMERTSPILNRCDRSGVESLLGSGDHLQRSMVKREGTTGDPRAAGSNKTSTTRSSKQGRAQVLIGGYPIAVWKGTSKTGDFFASELITDDKIPSELAHFLYINMKEFVDNGNTNTWNDMPPNSDTSVLRYLLDNHRPSGQPQERRACRTCSSSWVGHHRPCAPLQVVDGFRTLVFMPLRDDLRRGLKWHEKGFWLIGAE